MPKRLLYLLFFLSGASGLGYQLIWSKLFALGLGHEVPAVLGVLSAFMVGLALGAWLLDRPIFRRLTLAYALVELTIAVWGAVTALLIPSTNHFASQLIGLDSPVRHWLVAFALPLLVLLPGTTALGATFPIMERCLSTVADSRRHISAIYAINTLGAVAGTFGSIFWSAPRYGFRETLWLLAGLNLFCACAASFIPLIASPASVTKAPGAPRGRRLLLTLAVAGLLGIGLEVVVVRTLAQVLENTIYSYAAVLAAFLIGTSFGAAIYRFVFRGDSRQRLNGIFAGMAWSCIVVLVTLSVAPKLYPALARLFGRSMSGMIASELMVALLVLIVPTVFMGAAFSELVQSWRNEHGSAGPAVAANTFGAALAPMIMNLGFLPFLGSRWVLVPITLGYVLLFRKPAFRHWIMGALALLALALIPVSLRIIDLPPGGKLLDYHEGKMAAVAIVEDATRNRTLRVNNHFQMGGTGAADAEYRHAHIPLLLHPNPQRALILGLGTGITSGGALVHPHLTVDAVELLSEVAATLPQFSPWNRSPQENPAAHVHVADARRFVKLTPYKYDVIIADLFHPAQDGAGALYTLEHFAAIRARLAEDGLFCQWLPLHQLDEPTLKSIIRTFLQVFPSAQAYLLRFNADAPVVGLIGFNRAPGYRSDWIEERLADKTVLQEMKRLALADSIRFFGNLLAGAADLERFSRGAPLNTDNHPVVTFLAPRFAYQKTSNSYDGLLSLIERIQVDPSQTLQLASSEKEQQFAQKLRSYFTARTAYIHGLIAQAENRRDEAIDRFVESARLSPEFTPGYAQCLTLASVEARSNPAKARALLERLVAAQPERPVAREMLSRLFPQAY